MLDYIRLKRGGVRPAASGGYLLVFALVIFVYIQAIAKREGGFQTASTLQRKTYEQQMVKQVVVKPEPLTATGETTQPSTASGSRWKNPKEIVNKDPLNILAVPAKLKVYVYTIPEKFNWGLKFNGTEPTKSWCWKDGYGTSEFRGETEAIRNNGQFNNEFIIYHRFLNYEGRVYDPMEADLLYVPYFPGMARDFGGKPEDLKVLNQAFWKYLVDEQPYYKRLNGARHFMTMGRVELDFYSWRNKMLMNFRKVSDNVLFLGIDRLQNVKLPELKGIPYAHNVRTIPYPSMIHYVKGDYHPWLIDNDFRKNKDGSWKRLVACLLNPRFEYRKKLVNKCNEYPKAVCEHQMPTSIHPKNDFLMMKESVFCLNPAGDTWTRKGFYDNILSGCIPVLFEENIDYAFSDYYTKQRLKKTKLVSGVNDFHVPSSEEIAIILKKEHTDDPVKFLKTISEDIIAKKQKRMEEIAQYFQYSLTPEKEFPDAFDMLIRMLQTHWMPLGWQNKSKLSNTFRSDIS
eukprot:Nk52_evm18s621 gene=Nk52_evmTU18s621